MNHPFAALALSLSLLLAGSVAAAQQVAPAGSVVLLRNDGFDEASPRDASGALQRDYPLELRRGDALDATLTATFHGALRVRGPEQFVAANDGAQGATLRFVAPHSGVYVLSVASTQGSLGWFSLLANRAGGAPTPADAPVGPVQRRFGVFVGVTDYVTNEDTWRGAEDAEQLARTLVARGALAPSDAVVLTNNAATPEAVTHALRTVAARMTERDLLVFYFGGHGSAGSLSMPHGRLTSVELANALDEVPGAALVTIDACHAGSFQWVVERAPRRAGLFAAAAHETAYTAPRVQASGWLAYFLLRAAEGSAPMGSDGALQLGELNDFARRGYQSYAAPQTLVTHAAAGFDRLTLW